MRDSPQRWAKLLPTVEWWYNTSTHSATKMTPFEAVYGVPPPRLLSYVPGTTWVQAVENILKRCDQILTILKENLQDAQNRMKRLTDQHRTEREFTVGEWVYLRLQPYRQNSVQVRRVLKLSPKYYGPFQVLQQIGPVAYKLELPAGSRIHPVFHVSCLKQKIGKHVRSQGSLPPVIADRILQSQPEYILARQMVKQGNRAITEVPIKWKGASEIDATWEHYHHLLQRFPDINLEDKVVVRGLIRASTVAMGRASLPCVK